MTAVFAFVIMEASNFSGGMNMFNIKEKIDQIVEKLKNDDDLLEKFNKEPVAVLEEYIGVDLPDDKVEQLIDGIKAKLKLDKLGGALGGLGGLFGKK